MKRALAALVAVLAVLVVACGGGSPPRKIDPACPALLVAVGTKAPSSYSTALNMITNIGDAAPSAGFSKTLRPVVDNVIVATGVIGKAMIGLGQPDGNQLAAWYHAEGKLRTACGK